MAKKKEGRIGEEVWLRIWDTPYSPELVEGIKAIPVRSWDNELKSWYVPARYYDQLADVCADALGKVPEVETIFMEPPPPPPAPPPKTRSAQLHEAMGLTEQAPDDLVKSAYKAWSRKLHPDVGGSEDGFRKLVAIYEEICQIRSIQP